MFENRFSRFLPDSEVNKFRNAKVGVYPISKELELLLRRADMLRELTNGVYDPAVGEFLEKAGYNPNYTFLTSDTVNDFVLPKWSLESDSLRLHGPTIFDFGGIGKGYAIDLVAEILKEQGYKFYMVEAGGDMYGTKKSDGSDWNIAIQYPGKYDEAVGVTTLRNEGVAVSDTFRRRWGKWNHVVNPIQRESIDQIVGAAAVAQSAWDADCMTSVLFLGEENDWNSAANMLTASYLVFPKTGGCYKSNNWHGEIFV